MRERLTVLITTKDEENNIRACIDSARSVADEVLVADSGSSDGTREIAGELGARVIEREYVNPGDFKNWAIPQASHSWVLLLDADERVTPELAREIEELLERGPGCDGYWIYRRSYLIDHEVRRSGWQGDKVLRLVRRDMARYGAERVHERMTISSGKVGRLRSRLEHYTYRSFEQYIEKLNRYTTWSAEDLRDGGRRASLWSIATRPAWRFLRQYVLQRGFLDGRVGMIVSLFGAFAVFSKYAKLWAMEPGGREDRTAADAPERLSSREDGEDERGSL